MILKPEAAADSQLNMTPMIDIVFQLILFFLFNLRFKALDYRIESTLPKKRGLEHSAPVDNLPHLRVSLVRVDVDDPAKARTKVRLAGSEWILPDVTKAGEDARDVVFRSIEGRIAQLHEGNALPGEIDCPEPTGSLVPHGDVIRVLDAFLGAGVADVNFEGAKHPLPRAR